jgi:hypothetical protein
MSRLLPGLLALLLFGTLLPAGACAKWTEGDAGGGYSTALSLPAGNAPTAVAAGNDVTVSWTVAEGGAPVAGYRVERYDLSGQPQAIGPGCAGTISTANGGTRSLPSAPYGAAPRAPRAPR